MYETLYETWYITTKGIVGLDLRWKFDVKLFPAKKLTSDYLDQLDYLIRGQFFAGK